MYFDGNWTIFNNGRAIGNISDINLLRQNDDKCHHQIVILVKVVNDAATPWPELRKNSYCSISRSQLKKINFVNLKSNSALLYNKGHN